MEYSKAITLRPDFAEAYLWRGYSYTIIGNYAKAIADCLWIDSSAVGVLAGLHVSIAQQGGVVGVTNLSTRLKNYFVMAKLITAFKHFNSENEAIVNL